MKEEYELKQTEFNSNVATLIRIDTLIKQAHLAACGAYPKPMDNDMFYIEILDREYIEANNKFTKAEDELALDHQFKIFNTMQKWGEDVYKEYTDFDAGIKNPKYYIARNEIKYYARQYEIFLMRAMGRHGMLLTDSKDALTKFRSG